MITTSYTCTTVCSPKYFEEYGIVLCQHGNMVFFDTFLLTLNVLPGPFPSASHLTIAQVSFSLFLLVFVFVLRQVQLHSAR